MLSANNWHKELLEKFCSDGIESFDDSEVLKLLLGYTSYFKNIGKEETNQIVDKLLVHIGSVSGVMDVFPEVVSRLTGMDKKSAMLLNMIPELARKYCRGNQKVDNTRRNEVFDTVQKIGDYLAARYVGFHTEVLSVLILDEKKRFISFDIIQEGSLSSAPVNFERILELLFGYGGHYFVLAHNHPDGKLIPSEEDMMTTEDLFKHSRFFGKEMLEHFIVCYDHYLPILEYMAMRNLLDFDEEDCEDEYGD